MNIFFTKMHGLGNDFMVINNMNGRIFLSAEQIKFFCDRHKGIGADGVILVESSKGADCYMNYYNADGSQAEMCGNGVRCVAKFLKDNNLKSGNHFRVNTRSGTKEIYYKDNGTFSVNMGKPVFSHIDFPDKSLELEGLLFHFVSVGNPHAVAFVDNFVAYDLYKIGPVIENNKIFPNRINVELVEQKGPKEFKVKVWERGCGATLACGTGASAVYAIAQKYKNTGQDTTIELPGGKLLMSKNSKYEIIICGPAESVYTGIVSLFQ